MSENTYPCINKAVNSAGEWSGGGKHWQTNLKRAEPLRRYGLSFVEDGKHNSCGKTNAGRYIIKGILKYLQKKILGYFSMLMAGNPTRYCDPAVQKGEVWDWHDKARCSSGKLTSDGELSHSRMTGMPRYSSANGVMLLAEAPTDIGEEIEQRPNWEWTLRGHSGSWNVKAVKVWFRRWRSYEGSALNLNSDNCHCRWVWIARHARPELAQLHEGRGCLYKTLLLGTLQQIKS